jgi:RsiW-degrading membrane proteinase PrsW (M82 family)
MAKGFVIGIFALTLIPVVWFARLITGTPPVILLAAVIPAVCYSALLVLIDRYEREPGRLLLVAFFWGAVIAAFLSFSVNEFFHTWITGVVGEDRARLLTPGLAAPIIEEISKATALFILFLFWHEEFDNVIDGIVYGALVGVGFAMSENIGYLTLAAVQGGMPGLVQSIYLRSFLGGFNHAAFTAVAGAGFGYAREARSAKMRLLVPVIGLVSAILQHSAWNTLASQMIISVLCNQEFPEGPCQPVPDELGLFVIIPLIVATFIGPGGLILLVITVLALRREAVVLNAELRDEVPLGTLTAEEYTCLSSIRSRLTAEWRTLRGHGFRSWRVLRQIHHTATELAFCRWRRHRSGESVQAQQSPLEDRYRKDLAQLRLRLRKNGVQSRPN